MKIDSEKYKDSIEQIKLDVGYLTEQAEIAIKEFEATDGEGHNLAPDEVAEQVQQMKDEYVDAVRVTANIHKLVDACAHMVVKNPKECKDIAAILKLMRIEVTA